MFDSWVGKILWKREWQPIQYSCLGNPMDTEDWRTIVQGDAESQTRLSKWQHTPSTGPSSLTDSWSTFLTLMLFLLSWSLFTHLFSQFLPFLSTFLRKLRNQKKSATNSHLHTHPSLYIWFLLQWTKPLQLQLRKFQHAAISSYCLALPLFSIGIAPFIS